MTAVDAEKPDRRASTARADLRASIKARQAAAGSRISEELAGQRQDLAPPVARPNELPLAAFIRLALDQVEPYDKNPRHNPNENKGDIKASIKKRGLEHRLVVTQRPGEKCYVLAAGGGTRYAVLRELWAETGDRRFYEMDFELRPYVSEAELMASHLSENLHRADMCFWDKARGIMDLKAELELGAKPLSPKEAADQFEALGLPSIGKTLMALYQFAVNTLAPLGDTAFQMPMLAVRTTLNPGYNSLLGLATKLGVSRKDFDERAWTPALQGLDETRQQEADALSPNESQPAPDWDALLAQVGTTLAALVGAPLDSIPRMQDLLRMAPDASREELLAAAQPSSPSGAASPPPGGTTNAGGDYEAAVSGHRPQTPRMPGVFSATEPAAAAGTEQSHPGAGQDGDDEDRPPARAVAEKEAQRRQQLQQQQQQNDLAQRGTQPPAASKPGQQPASPAVSGSTDHVTGSRPLSTGTLSSIEHRKATLRALAAQLAAHSRTLEGQIIENADLPMGWMVDVPIEALQGTPLGPQPKQIFWLLARASFQLHLVVHQPERLQGTRFAEFLNSIPPDEREAQLRWSLLQPTDGFEFLITWLIDPAYIALGTLAKQILTATMELVANHPESFTELGHVLEFQDLQESHQAQLRQAEQDDLDYFIAHGATQEMVGSYFPYADLAGVRFRPGRIGAIDLKTQQFRIYRLWGELQTEPSERARLISLHKTLNEEFPGEEISIASLHQAVQAEG